MSNLALAPEAAGSPDTLEGILLQLARHGRPSLSIPSQGWHCSIDMNTNATGASFTIRSEFKHATPRAAAAEALDRVRQALATLGGQR